MTDLERIKKDVVEMDSRANVWWYDTKVLTKAVRLILEELTADRKTEPTISKMEQVEDEPQTERSACDTCQWYNSGIPCGVEPSVCKQEAKDNPTEQEGER